VQRQVGSHLSAAIIVVRKQRFQIFFRVLVAHNGNVYVRIRAGLKCMFKSSQDSGLWVSKCSTAKHCQVDGRASAPFCIELYRTQGRFVCRFENQSRQQLP
jgi:hypothetical protein